MTEIKIKPFYICSTVQIYSKIPPLSNGIFKKDISCVYRVLYLNIQVEFTVFHSYFSLHTHTQAHRANS